MQVYISILRGINVGGHRIIKMEVLRSIYVEMGFEDCQTYIQSGNVVFRCKKQNTEFLEKKISSAIFVRFNFKVPVIVREIEDLREIVTNFPFGHDPSIGNSQFHITFLSEIPDKILTENLEEVSYLPDQFKLCGKTLYLNCPNGYGNTKLNNTFFENKLKVEATTRNWRTTLELLRMSEQISDKI